jgi:hypothetical protein
MVYKNARLAPKLSRWHSGETGRDVTDEISVLTSLRRLFAKNRSQ